MVGSSLMLVFGLILIVLSAFIDMGLQGFSLTVLGYTMLVGGMLGIQIKEVENKVDALAKGKASQGVCEQGRNASRQVGNKADTRSVSKDSGSSGEATLKGHWHFGSQYKESYNATDWCAYYRLGEECPRRHSRSTA